MAYERMKERETHTHTLCMPQFMYLWMDGDEWLIEEIKTIT